MNVSFRARWHVDADQCRPLDVCGEGILVVFLISSGVFCILIRYGGLTTAYSTVMMRGTVNEDAVLFLSVKH